MRENAPNLQEVCWCGWAGGELGHPLGDWGRINGMRNSQRPDLEWVKDWTSKKKKIKE